jgi:hypothetical protein
MPEIERLPTMFARHVFLSLLLSFFMLLACRSKAPPQAAASPPVGPTATASARSAIDASPVLAPPVAASAETAVLMHNVILNEPPGLQLRVRWLRGQMSPTRRGVVPSFDDPASFVLDIQAGVIAVKLADVATLLNTGMLQGSSLKNISLSAQGKQLRLNGTFHKGVPLPVEMISDLSATPDGRVHLHVVKLRVLKLPVKGLLKSFDIKLVDLLNSQGSTGMQLAGNDDIYFNPEHLLPAPRVRGKLTDVHIGNKGGDLISVFGAAAPEVNQVKQWRNFIRLRDGTVNLGKLTMSQADIFLIDDSDDEWFIFDLTNYQEQLVNGRIQMTPQAGLRIFMPDMNKIPPNAANRAINLQWMKNRNLPPPADTQP